MFMKSLLGSLVEAEGYNSSAFFGDQAFHAMIMANEEAFGVLVGWNPLSVFGLVYF